MAGDDAYTPGHPVPDHLRKDAVPILVRGETVAWAVPIPNPNLGAFGRSYLAAINQALAYAVVLATGLALLLGVFFGNRLGRDLGHLTAAIQAMGEGRLLQQVKVRTRDEVGILGAAFNRMSEELSRAHDELHRSNEEIRQQAALLKELSIRDPLTRLYNRRHFDEQGTTLFAQASRYGQPLTVMIGDIDFFKKINDNFSHATGDAVLRKVAELIQANTRESDIAARYGGEEFVIAFYRTPLHAAADLCDRLRLIIQEHEWDEIHPDLRVTMSMGLCDQVSLGSFEKMIGTADSHLYRAKQGGRNRVCLETGPTSLLETS